MAWFFAHIGPYSSASSQNIPLHARNELARVETDSFFLAAGGHKETSLSYENPNADPQSLQGWLVSGMGLLREGQTVKIMNSADWQKRISMDKIDVAGLDGHFVVLAWNQTQVRFCTDSLGIRNLLIGKTQSGIAFSSRYNWLKSVVKDSGFDFRGIGSYYYSSHQLGAKSLIKGVEKLVFGIHGNATKDDYSYTQNYWQADPADLEFPDALTAFGNLQANENGKLNAIGLSGGIDSRVILAARNEVDKDWAFTYDEGDQADILLAEKLAAAKGIEHQLYEPQNFDPEFLLDNLRHTSRVIGPRKPAFNHLHFQYYPELASKIGLMLHGTYGEVLRQGMLLNIEVRAKKALKTRDWVKITNFLNYYRPAIFRKEFSDDMADGKAEGIDWISSVIPDTKMSAAEIVEWIVLRVCVPFTQGWSQISDDEWFPCLSPAIQPSVIGSNRMLAVDMRKNGKALRSYIKSKEPSLAKFPLAKNNQTIPFSLGQLGTIAYLKMKGGDKRYQEKADPMEQIMDSMEEYIQDRIHSRAFIESEIFEVEKIKDAVPTNDRTKLRWWLTFDTWNEVLNEPNPFISPSKI